MDQKVLEALISGSLCPYLANLINLIPPSDEESLLQKIDEFDENFENLSEDERKAKLVEIVTHLHSYLDDCLKSVN